MRRWLYGCRMPPCRTTSGAVLIRYTPLVSQSGEEHSYLRSKHKYFLSLMREFKLCYDLDSERVLIPQLLPVKEPPFDFDEEGALRFVLHYPHFLPLSVMPRFMVRLHKDIKENLRWRTGVILENEDFGATALIRADNEARRISIYVNGSQRKDYLAVILLFFREINSSFEELNVRELVPMPDAPEITARYSTLLTYAKKGKNGYIPDDSDKEYSVQELLGLIQPNREDQVLELLRVIKQQLDAKESPTEVLNSLFKLEPSILGVGINLNELFKRILGYAKRK
ncbi:MAG: hypothetical protein D3924_08690 [Candidatus Electrothrix sp. AR4]|nr:hypothetical protein [Candidatus Electrothrix sp. AR4]